MIKFKKLKNTKIFKILIIILWSLQLLACLKNNEITGAFEDSSSDLNTYSICTDDSLTTGNCKIENAGVGVAATAGNTITGWSNSLASTNVSAAIPNGYYINQEAQFTDANLLVSNIITGSNIFGVEGSAVARHAACTDDALNAAICSTAANRYVTATAGNSITVTESAGSVNVPTGFYSSKTATFSDADLLAANVKAGESVFGVTGVYGTSFATSMPSTAARSPTVAAVPYISSIATSVQLLNSQETADYSGVELPSSGSYSYREVPNRMLDDDGQSGLNCRYATRPTVNCGTTQTTIAARIADCASLNPNANSWDGARMCNGAQGNWKLVVRDTSNLEVWQDQQSGMLWSSKVSTSANWCQASGNTQDAPVTLMYGYKGTPGTPITGNGTVGNISGGSSSVDEYITVTFSTATAFTVGGANCGGGSVIAGGLTTTPGSTVTWSRPGYCTFTITQGSINFTNNDKFWIDSEAAATFSCAPNAASGLQPASPVSFCAEAAGLSSPAGDNPGTGIYMAAKGRMGANSTPSVRWRLPTLSDYKLAEVNGIRFVMPDLGTGGINRQYRDSSAGAGFPAVHWSATTGSLNRNNAFDYAGGSGQTTSSAITNTSRVTRCIGRGL